MAKIIELLTEYEIAKATVGTLPKSSIHYEQNIQLSEEWEEIKGKLGLT